MQDSNKQERSVDIFARSVYRELKGNGYDRAEIMAFASSLLEQLAHDVRDGQGQAERHAS